MKSRYKTASLFSRWCFAEDEGAPPPSPPAAPPAPPSPPAAPPAPAAFSFGELKAENQAVLAAKGFKTADDVFDSLRNAESFVGLDKAQLARLPADRSKPENFRELFTTLGLPENAAGYEIKEDKERGIDASWAGSFGEAAHKMGLLPWQVKGVLDWAGQFSVDAKTKMEATHNQKLAEGEAAIREKFGAAYDDKVEAINAFLQEHGSEELDDYLVKSGKGSDPALVYLLDKVVGLVSEGGLPNDPGRNTKAMGAEAAKVELQTFETANHAGLISASHPDHKTLVAERERLLQLAYPAPKQG